MRTIRPIAAILSVATCSAWAQVTYQWTDITPPGGGVSSVGIHPLDGRLIVLRKFLTPGDSAYVMYSSDHGHTWSPSPTPRPPGWIYVHPGRPGVVYSSSAGGSTTKGELYRSEDFGGTWSSVFTAGLGESIQVFGADPVDSHAAYAFRIPGQRCNAGFGCIYDRSWEVVYTRNDGVDWTSISTLLGDRITSYLNAIGPTPADPTRLFVNASFSQILVSRDRGVSWASFDIPHDASPPIVPDPERSNVLYLVRHNVPAFPFNQNVLLRSEDDGATYREIFRSTFGGGPVVVDPLRTRTLWTGSPEYVNGSGYLFSRSDDAGDTWQTVPCPGPTDATASCPRTIFPSTAEPGIVYLVGNNQLLRGVPSSVRDLVAVEYQYEGNRYWLTSLEGEAYSQDYRQQPGDVHRTGVKWGAWNEGDAPAGAVGSCRFWPRQARTRVLVQQGPECDILKRDANWILEGENEFFTLPPIDNSCPAGTVTVNRFINLQPDFNHRWVADPAIAAEMKARGWYDEGVRFCARPLGPNE